jgi:hypothetical protein
MPYWYKEPSDVIKIFTTLVKIIILLYPRNLDIK